jgi:hypothetical protein
MQIDGWNVRTDKNGNFLRQSRENPNEYIITILNRYAIDIELLKEEIDKIPKEDLEKTLIGIIKDSIYKAPKMPLGTMKSHPQPQKKLTVEQVKELIFLLDANHNMMKKCFDIYLEGHSKYMQKLTEHFLDERF